MSDAIKSGDAVVVAKVDDSRDAIVGSGIESSTGRSGGAGGAGGAGGQGGGGAPGGGDLDVEGIASEGYGGERGISLIVVIMVGIVIMGCFLAFALGMLVGS